MAESCCTTPSAVGFWAAMFVLFYGAALLLGMVWPGLQHYGDTAILTALAAACFVNFGRNRTLHCGLTDQWLTEVLAVMEGDFDEKAGRAVWRVYVPDSTQR